MPTRRSKPPAKPTAAKLPPPVTATRLVFEVDGDAVKLVHQQSVDMAVTGADLAQQAHAGTYVDARDADGRTLARVIARGLPERVVEVFPERPGDPIVNVPVDKARGAFSVVLPSPRTAVRVAVTRLEPEPAPRTRAEPPAREAAPALRAVELGSFVLQQRP